MKKKEHYPIEKIKPYVQSCKKKKKKKENFVFGLPPQVMYDTSNTPEKYVLIIINNK